MSRKINLIVVHCAATKVTQDVGVAEIGEWHKARGWRRIGYHYVIRRDGRVESGRAEAEIGAHTQGHNANSIGVCMVGGLAKNGSVENNFTPAQFASLRKLLASLTVRYPQARIKGHRDLSPDADGDGIVEKHEWLKGCPSFDVTEWLRSGK